MTIYFGDGSSQSAAGLSGTGKVLKVVQAVKTDAELITTGTTWADIDDLEIAITPSSSSNKIFIMCDLAIASVNCYDTKLRLYRDSTNIYKGDSVTNYVDATKRSQVYDGSANGYQMENIPLHFLDTPGAGAHTYKLQASSYSTVGVYINRTSTWTASSSSGYDGTCASSMTIMEVSG